jgi:glycerol-3-phosphate acyltransferase PlsY
MTVDTLKGFVPAFLATIYVGHLAGVIAGGPHRPNISRLRAGTETRFRFRRSPQPAKS